MLGVKSVRGRWFAAGARTWSHQAETGRSVAGAAGALMGLVAVVGFGCQVPALPPSSASVPVWTRGMETKRATRTNLRTADVFLKSSNDLAAPVAVPAGSEAVITHYTSRRVDVRIHQLEYTMYPQDGEFDASEAGVRQFIDKYFEPMDSRPLGPAEQGPADATRVVDGPSELSVHVKAGQVVIGMTKEQVYRSLGPPRFIEVTEIPTLHLSRERILGSDYWIYTRSVLTELFPKEEVYVFEGGRLHQARL